MRSHDEVDDDEFFSLRKHTIIPPPSFIDREAVEAGPSRTLDRRSPRIQLAPPTTQSFNESYETSTESSDSDVEIVPGSTRKKSKRISSAKKRKGKEKASNLAPKRVSMHSSTLISVGSSAEEDNEDLPAINLPSSTQRQRDNVALHALAKEKGYKGKSPQKRLEKPNFTRESPGEGVSDLAETDQTNQRESSTTAATSLSSDKFSSPVPNRTKFDSAAKSQPKSNRAENVRPSTPQAVQSLSRVAQEAPPPPEPFWDTGERTVTKISVNKGKRTREHGVATKALQKLSDLKKTLILSDDEFEDDIQDADEAVVPRKKYEPAAVQQKRQKAEALAELRQKRQAKNSDTSRAPLRGPPAPSPRNEHVQALSECPICQERVAAEFFQTHLNECAAGDSQLEIDSQPKAPTMTSFRPAAPAAVESHEDLAGELFPSPSPPRRQPAARNRAQPAPVNDAPAHEEEYDNFEQVDNEFDDVIEEADGSVWQNPAQFSQFAGQVIEINSDEEDDAQQAAVENTLSAPNSNSAKLKKQVNTTKRPGRARNGSPPPKNSLYISEMAPEIQAGYISLFAPKEAKKGEEFESVDGIAPQRKTVVAFKAGGFRRGKARGGWGRGRGTRRKK